MYNYKSAVLLLEGVRRKRWSCNWTDQMSKEVRLWLQPSDSVGDWRKLQQTQIADTCTWLLGKDKYNTWADAAESSILWIYGKPGSSKSVFASYIIGRLRSQGSGWAIPLIYFFLQRSK